MRRSFFVLGALVLLFSVSLLTSAAAQETPVCGPPGEELPATIVGAGHINGTPGDDVIVGSAGVDVINGDHLCGCPGDDTLAGLGGNDTLVGVPGNDDLIGFGGDDIFVFSPREAT